MNNIKSKTKQSESIRLQQGKGEGVRGYETVVEKRRTSFIYFIVDSKTVLLLVKSIPADYLDGSSCSFAEY